MTASKWSATMYVDVFRYAQQGMLETQIASALGVSLPTFTRWKSQRPALRKAWEDGRKGVTGVAEDFSFADYCYERLPSDLQDVWDELNTIDKETNDIARCEALLARGGKQMRQHLFIHALTTYNFNISKACRVLQVRRQTYDNWCKADPDFAKLVDEMLWHKDNFFENAFMGRVAAGDTAAIIHAVKTQLRDRGYNDRQDIHHHHDGQVSVGVTQVNILELDLDLAVRKAILEALRLAHHPNIIDTELVPANA